METRVREVRALLDNLTHSLAGIALGRTLDRREGAAAAASVWTALLASNVADADFFLPPIVNGTKIEFLVHHRGWTHTLVLVPVLAVITAGIVLLLRRWRAKEQPSRAELLRLTKIAAAGVTLHIALDFLNSYGVHPFAPFWRGWVYGDVLFIAEPLLWWSFLPFVASAAATTRRRVLWLAGGSLLLVPLTFVGSPAVALGAAAFAAASWAAQRTRPGTGVAFASAALVVAVFTLAGFAARGRATGTIAAGAPSEQRLDLVSSPAPANPLCWRVHSVGADGDDYVVREGSVSILPALFTADECFPAHENTAPLEPAALPSSEGVLWRGEFRRTLPSFRDQPHDCRVAALLGFMRVPYWTSAGHRSVFGDLRYDFGGGESFGEVRLNNVLPDTCPSSPWIPPRADLLPP